MSDSQNLAKTGGGELIQTGNPQIIGSPTQATSQGNLQSNTNTVLAEQGLKISSVGSSTFKPVNISVSTSIPSQSTPKSRSLLPLSIGIIATVAVLIASVVLAFKKSKY